MSDEPTEPHSKRPEHDDSKQDIVSWVVGGLLVALLIVNVVNWMKPAGSEVEGSKAPDFDLPAATSAETVSLQDYRGKVVLMDFWATWCPPCKDQMENLKVFSRSAGDDVKILSVNTDEAGPKRSKLVRDYLKRHDVSFPTALDDGSVAPQYGIQSLPTLVVVAPDGTIQSVRVGVHPPSKLKSYVNKARK